MLPAPLSQYVYEHFIVSLVLNKKILGEIARDFFYLVKNLRRYGRAPGSGGISFQLELDALNYLLLSLKRRNPPRYNSQV